MQQYSFSGRSPFYRVPKVAANFQQNLTPFTQSYFTDNPTVGYDRFMQLLGPSTAQEETMRALYNRIFNQFRGFQAQTFGNSRPTNWMDYLSKNVDWNKEFARLGPNDRRENPSAFNRPTRTLSFL